jgi:opacity protein-like surface antigen
VLNGTISTRDLGTNPYHTQWYQYYQQRDGSIYGYGGAVSAGILANLTVGVSGLLLKGTVDDLEARVGRGLMTFYNNYLRLSKNDVTSYSKTGTSEFSGAEFTLSAKYSGRFYEFGVAVKPPTTIIRKYSGEMRIDSVTAVSALNHRVDSLHTVWTSSPAGEDNLKLPWRGTVGLSVKVSDRLTVGLGYEIRSYALAVYTGADGVGSNPWLSASLWQVGAEFRANDWLTLRGGVREDHEVYEPLSNAIRGEAVKYTVYSLGLGIGYANVNFNLAYEYADMKYVDTWSNAASVNRELRGNVVADVSYDLPW